MAVTIQKQISNQQADSANSYCYLYEPLRIDISETDSSATKIYIKLIVVGCEDTTTIVDEQEAYGEYDLNTAKTLTVDLMKLAQQYHDANVYNYQDVSYLAIPIDGWHSIISKYRYEFEISSDVSTAPISVIKTPIIGGRTFRYAGEALSYSNAQLTEFERHNIDVSDRWYMNSVSVSLADPTSTDLRPTVTIGSLPAYGSDYQTPCGGMLYWKSRLGGWMYWGMDLKKKNQRRKYTGNIPTGLYEASYGGAYVQADYTGIETSYTVTVKSLGLSSEELEAVQGILASPAVYYKETINDKMELMRVTSATAPIDNKANGGDFTVSLGSISTSSQMTR